MLLLLFLVRQSKKNKSGGGVAIQGRNSYCVIVGQMRCTCCFGYKIIIEKNTMLCITWFAYHHRISKFGIWKKGKKEKKSRFGIPIAFISLCQSVVLLFVFFFWFFYEFLWIFSFSVINLSSGCHWDIVVIIRREIIIRVWCGIDAISSDIVRCCQQ